VPLARATRFSQPAGSSPEVRKYSKLTDKANRKWKVQIWNPNSSSTDSGGRLHNYKTKVT